MDYQTAHEQASTQKTPIRRASWPQGHHVEHLSESRYRLHGDQPNPQEWEASEADQNAKDWEHHVPPQQP